MLLILLLAACESSPRPPDERSGHYLLAAAGLDLDSLLARVAPPQYDSVRTDSILADLLPLLLSDPISRNLENWYMLKSNWEPAFGNPENLLHYTDVAYNRCLRRGNLRHAAQLKVAAARLNYLRGNYPETTAQYLRALNLARAIGDSVTVGFIYSNLAPSYVYAKDVRTAEDYYRRGWEMGQQLGNEAIIAHSTLGQGTLLAMTGQLEEGLALMEAGLEIAARRGFTEFERYSLLNLSHIYTTQGNFDGAIEILSSRLSIDQAQPSIVNALLNYNLSEAYLGKGRLDRAGEYLRRGCALSDTLVFALGSTYCQKGLSELHERRGDYVTALHHYKEYQALQERQTGEEANRNLQSLKTKQALKDKDLEILQLGRERRERERAFRQRRSRYFGIATVVGTAVAGLFLIVRYRVRAKLADQRKTIAETKLQVLQAQMNPHFIYNAMNGIQNYILKSDRIEAYSYLGKFAALLRIITKYATRIAIDLEEEVRLIRTYLDLEKLRHRDAFEYHVEVAPELLEADAYVPSMMIQPVVENAMIHGLAGLDRPGRVTVTFRAVPRGVECVVEDNGRGRAAAAAIGRRQPRSHLSLASVNILQRLSFLRKIGHERAAVRIEDLYQKDFPTGTRVSIFLPFISRNNSLA